MLVLFRLVFSQLERTAMQAVQHATQKSFSSLTNRSDQGDDSCHEENFLEGGNRGGIYHLPLLFQSLDGGI